MSGESRKAPGYRQDVADLLTGLLGEIPDFREERTSAASFEASNPVSG